jgi:hypothetical protein
VVVKGIALVKIQEVEPIGHALANVAPARTVTNLSTLGTSRTYTEKKNHCVWPSVNMSLRRVQSYSYSATRMALFRFPLSNRACTAA